MDIRLVSILDVSLAKIVNIRKINIPGIQELISWSYVKLFQIQDVKWLKMIESDLANCLNGSLVVMRKDILEDLQTNFWK